jgi:flagellar biosynthetic protein FlhB
MPGKEDRTEKPTAKRKRDARQEGQIAKTPELAGWLSLLAVTELLPDEFRTATNRLVGVFTQASHVMANPTPAGALAVLESGLGQAVLLMAPVLGVIAALSLFATVAQVGFVFATKAAAPKLSRLSPIAGIKNLFSARTVWQLLKEIVKLLVVGFLSYQVIDAMMHRLVLAQPTALTPVLGYTATLIIGLVREVAVAGLIIAVGDYTYQRHQTNSKMKMTKQEVKEDNRRYQGDPLLKGAIRRKQIALSRSRIMAAVAGADVVVMNPTHFAVALRYEAERGQAPRVVAKGADHMALRIREEAHNHGVAVVEDPPLARALYGSCEVDTFVPVELYVAVARLLAFVFTLPQVVKAAGMVHQRSFSAMVG